MSGIYLLQGTSLTISNLSFRVGSDGEVEIGPANFLLSFDACPTWLRLSKRHLQSAVRARTRRDAAWAGADKKAKARTVQAEFEASMQAIVSTAIAWDAAYAALRQRVTLPESLITVWRNGRTPRYSQVTEVIRRAFRLKPEGVKILRNNLKEIYKFRDLAVHPSAQSQAAPLHPELGVGMGRLLVSFRATSAEIAVLGSAAMFSEGWRLSKGSLLAVANDIPKGPPPRPGTPGLS